jgi:hypothetical protein
MILFFTWFPRCFMAVPCSYRYFFWTQGISHHAWQCTSNTYGNRPHTYEFVFKFIQDPYLQKRTQSILNVKEQLRTAKDLTTISTMMLPPIKRMKFFIALETVANVLVRNPFFARAKWCLDYFANLIIHELTISSKEKLLNQSINKNFFEVNGKTKYMLLKI